MVYSSHASSLVVNDTNGSSDIFVVDNITGHVDRISTASDGGQANGASFYPGISADGRFISFVSSASNLVAGDTNSTSDIFVKDQLSGQIERVSTGGDGSQGNGPSNVASISADGRFVTYDSAASNLVSTDNNGRRDVFLTDRTTGDTTRVSIDQSQGDADSDSSMPAINADGRYVTFESNETDLVENDSNNATDISIYDRLAANVRRVSLATDGSQANGDSNRPAISADGRYVTYVSLASNLVAQDNNGYDDIRDRQHGGIYGQDFCRQRRHRV